MSNPPDWDLLVIGVDEDPMDYVWFPAKFIRDNKNLIQYEGIRFRNAYLSSRAIETGSAGLFETLYRTAKINRGVHKIPSGVLHISDYREDG